MDRTPQESHYIEYSELCYHLFGCYCSYIVYFAELACLFETMYAVDIYVTFSLCDINESWNDKTNAILNSHKQCVSTHLHFQKMYTKSH